MTAPRQMYSARDFLDAIPKSAGIISTIATRVGCDWHTAKKYIEAMQTVKQAYEDECERVTDMAESKLLEAIQSGDAQMIRYYLSTKGKRRGYVERTEITGKDGEAQKHEVAVTDGSIISKLLPELATSGATKAVGETE